VTTSSPPTTAPSVTCARPSSTARSSAASAPPGGPKPRPSAPASWPPLASRAGTSWTPSAPSPAPLRFRRSLPHLTCTWVVSPRRHYAGARVRASLEPTADSPSDPP
jgi:hypothetical protein